ncbi:MAG: 2TM domain-containing protein [Cyclobacteriaceae bacterium]|nr:2TM domain-containing protein [Cyclobacteriaceae bacterium]
MIPEDEKLYKAAKKKVKRTRDFYSNILAYFAIGAFLTFINWWTSPGHWWVKWVWIGWGIGVFFHGLSLYRKNILFSDDWEERKIKEEIERMKRS